VHAPDTFSERGQIETIPRKNASCAGSQGFDDDLRFGPVEKKNGAKSGIRLVKFSHGGKAAQGAIL
jgi:hypothetical protein